jgi:NADH-quinone oxidoreductase subunit G
VNTEGRPHTARRALYPPGDAREDWAILRALSEVLGATLPFDSLDELHRQLYDAAPHLRRIGQIAPGDPSGIRELADAGGQWGAEPFPEAVRDFYFTNPIARASRIMADMSRLRAKMQHGLAAAE